MLRFVTANRVRLAGALVVLLVILGASWWALRPTRSSVRSHPAEKPPTQTVSPSPSHPSRAAPGWRKTFDARFTGSRIDTSVWATCYPWANTGGGCTNFSNVEYDWDLPSQVQVSDGALRLAAQRAPTQGQDRAGMPREYQCRSGMVTTYPSLRFEYGYLQVVARFPRGAGLWSALWLAAANLQWPPEMDIVENWGPPYPRTTAHFHPAGGREVSAHLSGTDFSTGWHTFSLLWNRSELAWFADGKEVLVTDQNVPHQPMYFLANLAEYRTPDSAEQCNGELLLQSVSLWQR